MTAESDRPPRIRPFTEADAEWFADYWGRVGQSLRSRIEPHQATFQRQRDLFDRLDGAREVVLRDGWRRWSAFEEAHNELCVAAEIVAGERYPIASLEYEPAPERGERTIDFRATGNDGRRWLIDVKTIAPLLIDRWDQFETARRKGWLSPRVDLTLIREGLGGELWHLKTASRSRMLEYTLELESKLEGYRDVDSETTILMFCTNGFDWHEDELEDFVAFYADGTHRYDDALASMEQHAIERRSTSLPRRVKRFGYCERNSLALHPSTVNWQVRPPRR